MFHRQFLSIRVIQIKEKELRTVRQGQKSHFIKKVINKIFVSNLLP